MGCGRSMTGDQKAAVLVVAIIFGAVAVIMVAGAFADMTCR